MSAVSKNEKPATEGEVLQVLQALLTIETNPASIHSIITSAFRPRKVSFVVFYGAIARLEREQKIRNGLIPEYKNCIQKKEQEQQPDR